jgi:hypothetical protein
MSPRCIRRRRRDDRRGAAVIEAALILPLTFLLLIGLMIGILGVFRYNQVAALASEGARWAAVHGRNYEDMNKTKTITSDDVFQSVIKPRAAGLDPAALTCLLTWNENHSVVSVRVDYQWLPEAYFGAKTLSCTAISLVSN